MTLDYVVIAVCPAGIATKPIDEAVLAAWRDRLAGRAPADAAPSPSPAHAG